MYDMRVLDFDWRWIAKLTGYASIHSAQGPSSPKSAIEPWNGSGLSTVHV